MLSPGCWLSSRYSSDSSSARGCTCGTHRGSWRDGRHGPGSEGLRVTYWGTTIDGGDFGGYWELHLWVKSWGTWGYEARRVSAGHYWGARDQEGTGEQILGYRAGIRRVLGQLLG